MADLRNVQEPVLARQKLHDRTEIEQLQHGSVVDPAYFDVGGDVLDAFLCGEAALGVDTGNRDRTVVGDFDRGSGLFLQSADHYPALADHVADFLGIDLDLDDARGVARNLGTRSLQRLLHDAEDVHAAFARLGERDLHDLLGNTLDFDVHLQGSHAAFSPRHLEVHVAKVVLVAQDVGEHREAPAVLDEAHRDSGDVILDRHAGVHEREAAAADRGHRG